MPSENERQNMKKIIAAATLLAIAGANVQTAQAGDHGWATVGKVLTGVAAGVVIANALDCHPAQYSVTYSSYTPVPCPAPAPVVYAPVRVVYASPPVVYAPAPVVVYQSPVYVSRPSYVRMNFGHGGDHRHRHRGCPHCR